MSDATIAHEAIDRLEANEAAARAEAATATADRDRLAVANTELARNLERAEDRAATLTADLNLLELNIAGLTAERDKARTALTAALARIAELEGNEPDPDPDPPATHTMTVGAIIGPQCHTVPAFITAIGTPGVRRYFSQGDFAPITSFSAVNQDLGKWDRLISYKPPGLTVNRTRLTACLDSIPDDGRRTVIMCQNEPERADKGLSAAAWRPYVNDFIEQVVDWADLNGRTDVLPGWSFSYWRPLTDPTISEWWPTCPNRARAVFGCQSYDPNSRKTLEEQTKIPVDRWRAAAGDAAAPWMLSEVNTKRTGADGAKWWQDGLAWAAGYGCIAAAVYDDVVGKDGPWCVVDRTVQQTLGRLMPAITVDI